MKFSRFKLSKVFLISVAILANIFLWQNCAPGFHANNSINSELYEGEQLGTEPINLDNFEKFQKIMANSCNSCHGGENSNFGNISNFVKLKSLDDWIQSPRGLIVGGEPSKSLVYRKLRLARNINNSQVQTMPVNPNDLSQKDADFIGEFILGLPKSADLCLEHTVVADKTLLRRLNRSELINSVRMLTGVNHPFSNIHSNEGGTFGRDGNYQSTDQGFFDAYYDEVEKVADAFIAIDKNKTCLNRQETEFLGCVENQLVPIAELAFRKELSSNDRNEFMNSIRYLNENNDYSFSNTEKLKVSVMSILTSPNFLYLIRNGNGSGQKFYNDFELATKVSLALWQQIPDRTLWEKAKNGDLSNNNKLNILVQDMISNSKINIFAQSFLNGWLNINKIDDFSPDPAVLGITKQQFSPIATDLKNETYDIFRDNISNSKSINSLVNGSTRFLNERSSRHLGIKSNITGNNSLRRFELPTDSPFAETGLLTSALLVSTSLPERSSIVFRGESILYSFYCDKVGEAPDNVPELEDNNLSANASQRDIALAHSTNPVCASCHNKLDPFGLALENFSPLGQFRSKDRHGNAINASTSFDGHQFSGAKGMAKVLALNNRFKSCFTEINLSYFTEQTLNKDESLNQYCAIKSIENKLTANNDSIKNLIKEIMTSDYFRKWSDQ